MAPLPPPLADQVTPFARRVSVNSPTAEYDYLASNPTPPTSPFPQDPNHSTSAQRENHPPSRTQTKRPRRNIGPYQLTRTLGSGSMGKVKLAVNNDTGEKCAVKIIPRKAPVHKNAPKDESRDIRIHREIALMMLLDHPYIVSLKEAMVMPHHYYLFFEYVSGGQILDYIISHGKLKEKQARKFARQMLSAIEYCHRHSVVHRDLKIENILITEEGDIKIIDFGLSNLFSTHSQLSTFCGSLYFAAPELLSAQEYTGPEVDIWSLGIVFYVLVCGRVPFDDPNMPALHAKIKKGNVSYPSWLSKECKHLLTRMLVTNPAERANMAELLRHPWINKGYDEPVDIYYPTRQPIQLPLDTNVIQRMKGFEFGNDEKIKSDLEELLSNEGAPPEPFSPKIKDLRKKAFFKNRHSNESGVTNQPLISIYYLVQEKMERERLAEEAKYVCSLPAAQHSAGPDVIPEIVLDTTHEPEKPELTSPAGKSIRFERGRSSNAPTPKSSNVLRRLSSAVRPGKPPLFHRFSQGPERGSSPVKSGYGERFSRRISRLITRHVSMQEPKLRNSMSELDALVTKPPKSPLAQDISTTPPAPSPPAADFAKLPTHSEEEIAVDNHLTAKSMSLKGLFSVATTSTKKAKLINRDLIRALDKLNVRWKEIDGYLECIYLDSPDGANITQATFNSHDSSDTDAIASPEHREAIPRLPESTDAEHLRIQAARSATASKLANPPNKHSPEDGLLKPAEPKAEAAQIVRFQISLVKIRVVLRLHGIQFRRLEGPSWEYKSICSQILHELKL
ncbi:Serine/threonine-protein kinase [Entomophthora muscae]|uniref:Serine/threonine-protein kinase n=1 Tax=Entomophthora muscae TaxID=34485 RepID=A0ACC2TRC3_9FUNG|nr:Serine/threonine-protein kinase [Entomophthora muscae]